MRRLLYVIGALFSLSSFVAAVTYAGSMAFVYMKVHQ